MLVASAAAFAQPKVYFTREMILASHVKTHKAPDMEAKCRVVVKIISALSSIAWFRKEKRKDFFTHEARPNL